MDKLLLQILLMMAFCFAIGFAVAAVIKLIAYSADNLNFYQTHSEELKRLKEIRKLQRTHSMKLTYLARSLRGGLTNEEEQELERIEIESGTTNYFPKTRTEFSDFSIMDYYYPDDKIDMMQNSKKK